MRCEGFCAIGTEIAGRHYEVHVAVEDVGNVQNGRLDGNGIQQQLQCAADTGTRIHRIQIHADRRGGRRIDDVVATIGKLRSAEFNRHGRHGVLREGERGARRADISSGIGDPGGQRLDAVDTEVGDRDREIEVTRRNVGGG